MAGKKGSSGRPPKPTEVLKNQGTFRGDRHARRSDTARVSGVPQKPVGLTPQQDFIWNEVVSFLPPESLGSIDTTIMRDMLRWYAVYSESMSMLEQDIENKNLRTTATAAWDRFIKLAVEYGMTPVARARLQLNGADEESSDPRAEVYKLLAN